MKMKIVKNSGFYRLVVDDENINKMYGWSQNQPITLAIMSKIGMTKCWKLKDFRLVEHANGNANPFFSDYSIQKYKPISDDDAQNLKSKLTHYIEEDGLILWSTKDGCVTGGDKEQDPELYIYAKDLGEGAWSFKEAQKKFMEIKSFWENSVVVDLNNITIPHPDRQINDVQYSIIREKEKKFKMRK